MQQQRRHNPYPTTWEIPAGILLTTALTLLYGIHLGRSLATWSAGHGWTWPTPTNMISSVPGILAGDAHAGLAAGTLPADLNPPVLAWIVAVEVLLIASIITGSMWAWARWGPGRMLGMATPTQVQHVLGVSRLRKVRHIIRPDLYPKRALR